MINQSVIFIPVVVLKTEITKTQVMTKVDGHFNSDDRRKVTQPEVVQDDTGPDGWRIRIDIDSDAITITHIRKELPLGTHSRRHLEMTGTCSTDLETNTHCTSYCQTR